MKLLFCETCWDVFKLETGGVRSCKCGIVKGHYVNNQDAEVNGKGVSLAIGNGSLQQAIRNAKQMDAARSEYITKSGLIAWVRPHEGKGNPHTKINEKIRSPLLQPTVNLSIHFHPHGFWVAHLSIQSPYHFFIKNSVLREPFLNDLF